MYADTDAGRAEASPGLKGTCPSCGHPCRPKCGKIVIWHWAHHARADCDPWSEPITEWHLGWQRAVPPERREVVIGSHRADIVTASGGVVEIQHSPVSVDMITEREEFYGERMAWIFDATKADLTVYQTRASQYGLCGCDPGRACTKLWGPGRCRMLRGESMPENSGGVMLRWSRPRRSIAACRRPVFLDLGHGVLRIKRFLPGTEMAGVLHTRASVEGWLRDGAQLERIILPPSLHVSRSEPPYYDLPHRERERAPADWFFARQAQIRRRVFGADVPQTLGEAWSPAGRASAPGGLIARPAVRVCVISSADTQQPEAMMSSARDHYTKAEKLLKRARTEPDSILRSVILAEAQVHATLALGDPGEISQPSPEQNQAADTKSTEETPSGIPEGDGRDAAAAETPSPDSAPPRVPPRVSTKPWPGPLLMLLMHLQEQQEQEVGLPTTQQAAPPPPHGIEPRGPAPAWQSPTGKGLEPASPAERRPAADDPDKGKPH